MAITATLNDGVSLNTDKISYDLVETDVEIITSGRRSIPAHSGILVSFFSSYFLCMIEYFFILVLIFFVCLKLLNAGFGLTGTDEHHREAEEDSRRIIEESY